MSSSFYYSERVVRMEIFFLGEPIPKRMFLSHVNKNTTLNLCGDIDRSIFIEKTKEKRPKYKEVKFPIFLKNHLLFCEEHDENNLIIKVDYRSFCDYLLAMNSITKDVSLLILKLLWNLHLCTTHVEFEKTISRPSLRQYVFEVLDEVKTGKKEGGYWPELCKYMFYLTADKETKMEMFSELFM